MASLCWRLLLAVYLGGTTGGRWGSGYPGGVVGQLSTALGALGPLGSGPLVEGEAVRRVVEEAKREYASNIPLVRHYFEPSSRAVCNDNSPAGFYFRRSNNGSSRWIVFLDGGWYCFDRKSCKKRWELRSHLMTSRGWPQTRQVGGILSSERQVNPHWWMANHVFVPYCSSDAWSGTRYSSDGSRGFSFMGSVIVEEVIDHLVDLNLTHGHKLILAGSSAGGVGAMINVDRVSQQLEDHGIEADVRAVSDSGWFLDNEPFTPLECLDAQNCPPVEAIRRGQQLWQGRIPNSCLQEYPHHPWFCYFGYRAYPTMKSPLFVFQWVFDEAQMTANNVGEPISKEQWDYIHGIGERLRKTFENVTALFAPSCISHTVLTKKDWTNIKIGDVSLPRALNCWDIAPTTVLNTLYHQRENRTLGSSPSSTSNHNRVRHQNSTSRQRHRLSRQRERGKSGRKTRRRESARERGVKKNTGSNRNASERTRKGHQVSDGESLSDTVQSSHLVLIRGDGDSNNHSASVSESAVLLNVNTTADSQSKSSARTKSVQDTGSDHNSQGISGAHGKMLADSPGEGASGSSKTYLIESNAIETPQGEVQNADSEKTAPKRRDKGDRGEARRERRRNRKKKGRGKKGKKRKKKKERRRRLRERKRKQRERRKNKRKRPKVSPSSSSLVSTIVPSLTTHPGTQTSVEEVKTPSAQDDTWSSEQCPAHTLHLTDQCAWPHCNYDCPTLVNPFTGEEMNYIELLKSFGLDMASVATALGIDLHTLNSMGKAEILLILTQ